MFNPPDADAFENEGEAHLLRAARSFAMDAERAGTARNASALSGHIGATRAASIRFNHGGVRRDR